MADVIRTAYSGPFVIAEDLPTIDIGLTVTWREPFDGASRP